MNKKLIKKLKNIKLIVSDVDGVLTDGRIRLAGSREEIKIFNNRDGMRIDIWLRDGLRMLWFTGRKSDAVIRRTRELKVDLLFKDDLYRLKTTFLNLMFKRYKVSPEQILYIGDDWGDIYLMTQVGVSVAPKNGSMENKKIADIITKVNGGDGVLAEVIEIVMKTKGSWHKHVKEYFKKYLI